VHVAKSFGHDKPSLEKPVSLPVIGLTTYRTTLESGVIAHAASQAYIEALRRAGAAPLLIPLGLPGPALNELLLRLDGVLFTGGGDVHPSRYGGAMHPLVDSVDEDRDRIEIDLLHQAVKRRLPFLGICRGLQVINVALGGSLYEDLQDQLPGSLKHDYSPGWPRHYHAHNVCIEPGSRLARILGAQELPVNSLHHQGIRSLAGGLLPLASAPDGVIEAFELAGYPFGMAVQWHPECLPEDEPMQELFRAFVSEAGSARREP